MLDSHRLLKHYLYLLASASVVSGISFALVITKIEPMRGALLESSILALIFFFVSLFFLMISSFSLLIIGLRTWIYGITSLCHNFGSCLRQGILLSIIGILSLLLQTIRGLTWIPAILIILSAVLVEFYFQTTETTR